MKLRLTAAILILAAATSVAAQPATAPFNPLVNVSNTSVLRSDLADISMLAATTYVAWVEDNAAGQQIRLRRSNDGGASFIDGTSGRVIVTIDAAETVDSLRRQSSPAVSTATTPPTTFTALASARPTRAGCSRPSTRPHGDVHRPRDRPA